MKRSLYGLVILSLCTASPSPAVTDGVEAEILVQENRSWNGAPLPPYPQGEPEVSIIRIRIPPGSELPMHLHPVINAGVLLQGKLTVVTEAGDRLYLQAGDPIIEVVNQWHYGKNEGDRTAEIMVFYAGIKDQPLTIKQ